jgi:superfamily II DNA or RNA helicase
MLHQVEDVEWIHRVERGLLGNEPGLGKSKSAIDATKGMRTLIVAPAMVLNSGTWRRELERWSNDPDMYTVAPYTLLSGRVRTEKGHRPSGVARPEFNQQWDAVIIDESHYMKGRNTNWKAILERLTLRADLVLPMTGTPVPNWAHELFTTLRILFPDEAKRNGQFGSFWRWAEDWFDTSPNRWSDGKPVAGPMLACTATCHRLPLNQVCEHYQAFTKANLGQHYRRVWRKDAIDLPPVIAIEVEVPLEPPQRAEYNKLKRDFTAKVDGHTVVNWSQGSLNVAIDKFTVSPWMLHKQGPPRGGKLDRLAMDLSGRSRATLVFAHYRDVVEACHQVALGVGMRSAYIHGGVGTRAAQQAFADFHDGKIDVLVGSLEVLSEGHTLVEADMAIFVEKSWKTYRNEQARFRVDRIGQTRPVTILDYVAPKTVDSNKRRVIQLKTEQQIRTMTAAEFTALI